MATQVRIPDDQLAPGDLVDVEYLIQPGAAPGMVKLAVSEVKKSLANDERFNYQGSREETRIDKSGLAGSVREVQVIIITVQVADPRKKGAPLPGDPQKAAVGVSIAVLVAIVAGVAALYSAAIIYRSYTIKRIATSDQSDAVKIAALDAAKAPMIDLSKVGVGTIAIGALFLYALFGRKARFTE